MYNTRFRERLHFDWKSLIAFVGRWPHKPPDGKWSVSPKDANTAKLLPIVNCLDRGRVILYFKNNLMFQGYGGNLAMKINLSPLIQKYNLLICLTRIFFLPICHKKLLLYERLRKSAWENLLAPALARAVLSWIYYRIGIATYWEDPARDSVGCVCVWG